MSRFIRLVSLLALSAAFAPAQAEWPERTITMVMANSPGTGPAVLGALLADSLGNQLGQRVIVDHRTGALTIPATMAVVKAKPDGYTIYYAGNSPWATVPFVMKQIPFDPWKDLEPIAMVFESSPLYIAVHPGVAAETVSQLIDLAKKNPKKLSWGGSSTLGPLIGDLMNARAGIQLINVNYKETGQLVQDTVAGRVSVICASITSIENFVKAGKLRTIAITGARRLRSDPDVPTVAETMPGFVADGWFVLVGPAGFPADIGRLINAATDRFLKDPDVQKKMTASGQESSGASNVEEIRRFMRDQNENWRKIFADVGVKPQ